jgi:hypothetical protein
MIENIHVEPEVIDDIYSRLGINKSKETYQQIVEQNLIKESYKMGYADGTHKIQTEQMTKITSTMPIDDDYVLINGVRYKKVEEPKTLKELFEIYVEYGNWAQSKDVIAQELLNIVKEIIPKHSENKFMSEFGCGYNTAIKDVNRRLK